MLTNDMRIMDNKTENVAEKIIDALIDVKAYPESGYGSVTINIQNHLIVNMEKKESLKLK